MTTLNTVETKLTVAGKPCHFVHLTLRQAFNHHHTFEIQVDFEELDTIWMENPTKIIQLISQDVSIEMTHKQTGHANLFKGIITNVSMNGKNGEQNFITLLGSSPTILLEGSPSMNSFTDLTLELIVREAVDTSGNGAEVEVKPQFKSTIDYIAQYNENGFEFLNRLSWLYGEWFFYDGSSIYFGKPDLDDAESITYDEEMVHFDLSANLIPPNVSRYEYLNHQDNETIAATPDRVEGVRGYIKASLDQSTKVYASESRLALDPVIGSRKDLDDMLKVDKYRSVSQMLTIGGTTKTCKVRIGRLVSVNLPKTMRTSLKHVETFLVTEVVHEADQDGSYINRFKGIPSEMEHIPMQGVKVPTALSQIAWVTSNADAKGRIKVAFQWQKALNKTTNWLRVQTPDAGSSNEVASNRGFVFIPEEGDQVMINFVNGDPNRPYVSGSLFNENVSRGGGNLNKSKTISTRSGITIEFDDNQKSLLLKDASGSVLFMDGNGNIDIKASQRIRITSGQLELNSHNDVLITAKNNFLISVGNLINQTAGYLKCKISNFIHLFSSTSLISSKENMQLQARNVNALGTDMLALHSDSSIVANSMGVMDLKSIDNMSLTQNAQQTPKEDEEHIALAVVEFRPEMLYDGKYGFDWVRMGDILFDKKAEETITHAIDNKQSKQQGKPVYIADPAIETLELELETTVEKIRKATTEVARNVAIQKANALSAQLKSMSSSLAYHKLLEQEYTETLPILKKTTASNMAIDKYYVPFLHLYTQKVSDAVSEGEKPPFEAKLKVFVSIDEKLDALEFEYNKDYFTVDKNTLPDKNPCSRKESTEIKIACIADSDGFDSDQEILVWAYPVGSKALSKPEQDAKKKLAGKLIVGKNAQAYRNTQKVLLVPVKMDINDDMSNQKIDFNEQEKIFLRRFMYQALTFCEMETNTEKPILDLTGDDNFKIKTDTSKIPATTKYGKYIFEQGIDSSPAYKQENGPNAPPQKGLNKGIFTDETGFHDALRNKYLNTKTLKTKYKEHVIVFLFPEKSYKDITNPWVSVLYSDTTTLLGQANSLGGTTKSLVIFPARTRETIGHEVLHTMGLHHPFSNEKHVYNKYRYKKEKTDNVMDYGNTPKHALWRWQWRIINPNLNKK